MQNINHYRLNNGINIPCIGYGTWEAEIGGTEMLKTAIEVGYRYFDTASYYGTEQYVGEAIKESGIDRSEFFVASKVWKDEMGYEGTLKAFAGSLERLGMDYLDLYLIHWPIPTPDMTLNEWKKLDIETWRAMEKLYKEDKIKAIGISNFLPHHLENLIKNCEVIPAVDQLELHPGYLQACATSFCKENNILLQAWSPLGQRRLLDTPILASLAKKYNKSQAQITLRFLHQKDYIIIPKSSTKERMQQNLDIFDFEISKEDMFYIETLPQTGWSGEHPDYERVV